MVMYRTSSVVPRMGADLDFTAFGTNGATAGSTGTSVWSSVLDGISKAVDIGTNIWKGATSADVQKAQLELAKSQAQTEAERVKAQQLIAATQAAQMKQAAGGTSITGLLAGGGGIALLAVGALALFMFMKKK